MKIYFSILLFFFVAIRVSAQPAPVMKPGKWRALLHRPDGRDIVFNFLLDNNGGRPRIQIVNGQEKIPTENFEQRGDSVFFRMTVFESSFRARILSNGSVTGSWMVRLEEGVRDFPFTAYPADYRFLNGKKKPVLVGDRWTVTFSRLDTNYQRPAVAEFVQDGHYLTGTFLTPSGDYRYLEGVVSGDSIKLSTFDGHHSFLFLARVKDSNTLEGFFYSGMARTEKWIAIRNPDAMLPEDTRPMQLKDTVSRINFRFPDLDSNIVSLDDNRYKGKVVLLQIMGSWCANCMDEIQFLSEYYKKNVSRGFEVIALCYERSTNFRRSVTSIRKFQQRFDVQYPMLVTGVISDDPMKTEKTIPQLNRISAFPSFLVLNKNGKVVWIHTGFEGPGTGDHYLKFKEEFNQRIDQLLAEP